MGLPWPSRHSCVTKKVGMFRKNAWSPWGTAGWVRRGGKGPVLAQGKGVIPEKPKARCSLQSQGHLLGKAGELGVPRWPQNAIRTRRTGWGAVLAVLQAQRNNPSQIGIFQPGFSSLPFFSQDFPLFPPCPGVPVEVRSDQGSVTQVREPVRAVKIYKTPRNCALRE